MTFDIPPGSIVGVIGPNGAGKTTLLRMIPGGRSRIAAPCAIGDTVKLAYVEQSRASRSTASKTVWEEISGGQEMIDARARASSTRAPMWPASTSWAPTSRRRSARFPAASATGCMLAKMLKQGANVILLDEPTNDLDVNTLRALEEALENFAGCAVVVSHDRWFLDRMATHILAFEGDGGIQLNLGNFSEYEADRRKRLGKAADTPHRIKHRSLTR